MTKLPDLLSKARRGWRSWTRFEFLPPLMNALTSWVLFACVVGFLPGVGAWLWQQRSLGPSFDMKDEKAHLIRIKLTIQDQQTALLWGLGSLACLVLAYLIVAWRQRRRDGQWPNGATLIRWNLKCLPL